MALVSWPAAASSAGGEEENGDGGFSADLLLEQIASSSRAGSFGESFQYTEYSVRLEWQFLLLDLDHREYRWRKEPDSASEPWGKLTRFAPGLQYYREFRHQWGIWFKFMAIAGFEDTVSPQSWTYNPQIIGIYRIPARQMMLYGGAGTLHHPAYSITYPVLGIAWNTNSGVGFSAAVGFPENMVRYGFNERVAIKADFLWDIRTYRLSQDSPVAPGGYMKTEDLKPGLQIEYKPAPAVTLSLGARLYSGRSVTIFNRRKRELEHNRIDTSAAFLLKIDYKY